MAQHCMAMTTVGSEADAAALARAVVEAGLAACVQIVAIRSVYRWRGAVTEDDEQLLLMKTRLDRYSQLEAFVSERHPYQLPEIAQVALDAGLAPYLSWIDEATASC
jgi:periplasmic divalent cation tolerance protein